MAIKSFNEYLAEASNEVTFVFGRFNPPTVGHEKLFDQLKKISRGGVFRIYASKSEDKAKNPLPFKVKIKFLRKMFPKYARSIMADGDIRNALDVCTKLYDQGFTKVTMVAGSDRVREFDVLLNKYNGVKSRHGFYNFEDSIRVVSAGERDPDAEGAKGMSASKIRAAVAAGDIQAFSDGTPEIPGDSQLSLYYAIRKGMGLKKESFREHIDLGPVSEIREDYIEGSLFQVGNNVVIKETQQKGIVKVCGSNYLLVELNEGGRKRCWLDSVQLDEYAGEFGTNQLTQRYKKDTPGQMKEKKRKRQPQDPDIKDRPGTQPKGYFAKDAEGDEMAKSTKQARARHFEKGAKMSDDNPAAYKPAPGDARAKTKPSKHSKKFKDMFGEGEEIMLSFEDYNVTEGNVKAALQKKADKSGMPYGILKKVFDRGVAAWRTGHRPGTNPTQWGLARVNSFATKSKGTFYGADKDLAAKV
tara:strand:- start:746 stop:2158 length:1413 start_codon:yes stop_codon:yes gene_type:complete